VCFQTNVGEHVGRTKKHLQELAQITERVTRLLKYDAFSPHASSNWGPVPCNCPLYLHK